MFPMNFCSKRRIRQQCTWTVAVVLISLTSGFVVYYTRLIFLFVLTQVTSYVELEVEPLLKHCYGEPRIECTYSLRAAFSHAYCLSPLLVTYAGPQPEPGGETGQFPPKIFKNMLIS